MSKWRSKRYTLNPGEALVSQLVAIAQAPSITASELRAFLLELSLHAHIVGAVSLGDSRREIEGWSQSQIAEWQAELVAFIRGVVVAHGNSTLASERRQIRWLLDQFKRFPTARLNRMQLQPFAVGKHVMLGVDGEARDVLWFQIIGLLRAVGVERVQQCDCERLFFKTGRREFCSIRCQKRVYMKRVRAAQNEEETRHGKKTRTR